jgi:hypothetical protein
MASRINRVRGVEGIGARLGAALAAGLLLAAAAAAQDPPTPVPPAPDTTAPGPLAAPAGTDTVCGTLPVHTAALAEQRQLAGLGGLALPAAGAIAPPRPGPWLPETRLSDQVLACVGRGPVGPGGVVRAGAFWATTLPAGIELRSTTGYPRAMNDGSYRPGVGLLAGVAAGFAAGVGPVSVIVRPELHHHANADFEIATQTLPGHSPFVHPTLGTRIDLPQRFGEEAFQVLSPGQTTIRLDAGPVAAGASTENVVWGPGLRNPLLFSSAAPGLPHLFVGTAYPVDIRVGRLHVRTLVARATESNHFDGDPGNDHTRLSGTIASFEPAPLPGLTLGVARWFAVRDRPDLGWGEFLAAAFTGFRENPEEGDRLGDNQHASVFARWAFPEAGLQVHAEYARIDHWGEWADLVRAPQAAGAWMAGLQKVFRGDEHAWRVMVEAANLVDPLPNQLPNRPGTIHWYTHSQIQQGHTHQGQLLGAPIGPGGRQQVLAVDRYAPRWDIGLELARTVYNDDSYNQIWWRYFNVFGHDAELGGSLRGRLALGPVDLHGAVGYGHRWNRHFLGFEELVGTAWESEDLRREGSWRLDLRGVWARGGARAAPPATATGAP